MKNIIIFLLFCQLSFSQNVEKYFKNENYWRVTEVLQKQADKVGLNLYETEKLAVSYYYNSQYKKALPFFEKIADDKNFDPKIKFYYSHTLKSVGKDSIGNEILKAYFNDNRFEKNFDDYQVLKRIKSERWSIIKHDSINSKYSDILNSVDFNNNTVYFSSTRNFSLDKKKYEWNNQPYLDCFQLSKAGKLKSIDDVNTIYHESDFIKNKYNDDVYFTSSKIDESIFLKKGQVITTKIYKGTYVNGVLANIICLPINSNDYSTKSPFIDYENNRLYFSCNKNGNFDILYADLNTLTEPTALEDINTSEDEDNFFIDDRKNVFFSSNGYVGYGGIDVYVKLYDSSSNSYKRVMNLGSPLNSPYDDFKFYMKDNRGYFTSNRDNGLGDDDIYKFNFKGDLDLDKSVQNWEVEVLDKLTKQPLKGVEVSLNTTKGVVRLQTNELGKISIELPCNSKTPIQASLATYKDFNSDITTDGEKFKNENKVIELDKKDCFQNYNGVITDNVTKMPLENAVVQILDASKNIISEAKTDGKGYYQVLVPCDRSVLFKISKDVDGAPYYADYEEWIETDKIFDKNVNKNVELLQADSKGLVSDEKGNLKIPTKPIYFEYNSAEIKNSESVQELNKLSEILKEHPNWKLRVESHSDIRGTNKYNLLLSNKRAIATMNFLVKLGIDKSRMKALGFGEEKPLINCPLKECSEEEYLVNRRSEFIIE